MDTLRRGADPERLPERVREELTDVDRLREIWTQHRQGRPREEHEAARRDLVRRRVRELGGGPELADLLLSATAEEAAATPVTAGVVAELAEHVRALPGAGPYRSPEHRLDEGRAGALAEAAALPVHPVVRAAHVYAEAEAALEEIEGAGDGEWLLPWVLASLVLRRAGLPPLLPCRPPSFTGRGPVEGFAGTVSRFAHMVTWTMREELSWAPGDAPSSGAPVPPLAAVIRRRLAEHLRSRSEAVALILRALDPQTRTSVRSGGSDSPGPDRADALSAARTLLTPGAAHWWNVLELSVGDASLALTVVVQEIGRPRTGVLAVTADACLTTPEGARDIPDVSGAEGVTAMPTDSADERWPQIRDLVDEAVSRAMSELTQV